jgi:hypothetical protein
VTAYSSSVSLRSLKHGGNALYFFIMYPRHQLPAAVDDSDLYVASSYLYGDESVFARRGWGTCQYDWVLSLVQLVKFAASSGGSFEGELERDWHGSHALTRSEHRHLHLPTTSSILPLPFGAGSRG